MKKKPKLPRPKQPEPVSSSEAIAIAIRRTSADDAKHNSEVHRVTR
jgi:hypothetical protein